MFGPSEPAPPCMYNVGVLGWTLTTHAAGLMLKPAYPSVGAEEPFKISTFQKCHTATSRKNKSNA